MPNAMQSARVWHPCQSTLQSGGQPSKGMRQTEHTSSPAFQVQLATAWYSLISTVHVMWAAFLFARKVPAHCDMGVRSDGGKRIKARRNRKISVFGRRQCRKVSRPGDE